MISYMKTILIKLRTNLCLIIIQIIKYFPFTSTMILRNYCYSHIMRRIGSCNISDGVTILHPKIMEIGERVSIHPHTYIVGEVVIGNNVGIAAKCSIIAQTHNYSDTSIPFKLQGTVEQPISIGNDVWIGTNSVILGNTVIGDGVVIGAGSVVSGEISSNSVMMGNPARVFFNRKKTDFNKA